MECNGQAQGIRFRPALQLDKFDNTAALARTWMRGVGVRQRFASNGCKIKRRGGN